MSSVSEDFGKRGDEVRKELVDVKREAREALVLEIAVMVLEYETGRDDVSPLELSTEPGNPRDICVQSDDDSLNETVHGLLRNAQTDQFDDVKDIIEMAESLDGLTSQNVREFVEELCDEGVFAKVEMAFLRKLLPEGVKPRRIVDIL